MNMPSDVASSFAEVRSRGKPKTFEDIDKDMDAASAELSADSAWQSHSQELRKAEEQADKNYEEAENAEKVEQRQDDEDERKWAAEKKADDMKDMSPEQRQQELEG